MKFHFVFGKIELFFIIGRHYSIEIDGFMKPCLRFRLWKYVYRSGKGWKKLY